MANLIGTAPNQVPTNADLGRLAFIDALRPKDVGALALSFADLWTLGDVNAMTVINVGPNRTYTSIQSAVISLEGKAIKGTVKIKVDDGTYNMGAGLYIGGSYISSSMSKIIIEGNVSSPQNCVLQFTKGTDNIVNGVVCQNYSGYLQFSGFRLVGDSSTSLANNRRGINVSNGAAFWSQNNSLMIDGFNSGFEVYNRSYAHIQYARIVNCLFSVTAGTNSLVEVDFSSITGIGVTYNGQNIGYGVWATDGGIISANGVTIANTSQGVGAYNSGIVYTANATISNCWRNVAAYYNGLVSGDSNTISTSTDRLVAAGNNGVINFTNCTLDGINNSIYGFLAQHSSFINAFNCTVKNCSLAYCAIDFSEINASGSSGTGRLVNNTTNYNSTVNTVNSSGGYIVAS